MIRNKKITSILLATSILSVGGNLITPFSVAAQTNQIIEKSIVGTVGSTILDLGSKYNLDSQTIDILEQMKKDYIVSAQKERGLVGNVNTALKWIVKYVNFLPNSAFKRQLLKVLNPIINLANKGQIITISVVQITLKSLGCPAWFIEMLIDFIHFLVF